MPTVTLTLFARVDIDSLDMYEHQIEGQRQRRRMREGKNVDLDDCDCWKETATAKEISQCMAFNEYIGEEVDGFAWDTCKSDAPDLPLEPLA